MKYHNNSQVRRKGQYINDTLIGEFFFYISWVDRIDQHNEIEITHGRTLKNNS